MKKRFWNTEKLLSYLAILLSVGTLLVFIYQTNLIRKQQYAGVYPYLEMGFHNRGFADLKYVLTNVGVGPAILERVEVEDKEGSYEGSFSDYLVMLINREQPDSIYYSYSDITVGKMIPAGKSIELLACDSPYSSKRVLGLIEKYQVELNITYTSVYGERWYISSSTTVPVKKN